MTQARGSGRDYAGDACGYKTEEERRVKLFKNGRNQAVRIPRDFELPGEEAIMRRVYLAMLASSR